MYFIDFEQLDKIANRKVSDDSHAGMKPISEKVFFKLFSKNTDSFSMRRNLNFSPSIDAYYVYSHTMKERSLLEVALSTEETKPTAKALDYKSFTMIYRKNRSKFGTSKIYGLKEKFETCPNILLSKDEYKAEYKSATIPEYNYDLLIDSSDKSYVTNLHPDDYAKKINPIADHCINEILEVFSAYGEIENVPPRKNHAGNTFQNYYINNSISFALQIERKYEYKLGNNGDIIPNLKLEVKLQKSEKIEKQVKKKGSEPELKKYNQRYVVGDKYQHFTIEIRNFDFLKTPAYYAICMTPHGYLRLKKEYSKEFFKKIIFHYQFKKFFEKYEIDLNLDDLEDNPQAFFDLVSMITFS